MVEAQERSVRFDGLSLGEGLVRVTTLGGPTPAAVNSFAGKERVRPVCREVAVSEREAVPKPSSRGPSHTTRHPRLVLKPPLEEMTFSPYSLTVIVVPVAAS